MKSSTVQTTAAVVTHLVILAAILGINVAWIYLLVKLVKAAWGA